MLVEGCPSAARVSPTGARLIESHRVLVGEQKCNWTGLGEAQKHTTARGACRVPNRQSIGDKKEQSREKKAMRSVGINALAATIMVISV